MHYVKLNVDRPLVFVSAGTFTAAERWIHQERTVTSFEIIIGVRDSVYMMLNDTRYEIRPGQVLLIQPHQPHIGYEWSNRDCSFHWLHFQYDDACVMINDKSFQTEIQAMSNNPYLDNLDDRIYLPTFFVPPAINRINIIFHQLLHIMESKYFHKSATDYLVTSLAIELSEQAVSACKSAIPEANDHDAKKKLMRMLEWIRVHSAGNVSVRDMAQHFQYNKDYLTRFFKQHMGMGIQEYIHRTKIDKSKDMLYQTTLSIKEIAYALGFRDEKYFMKLFKRHENMTPTNFRRTFYRTHLNMK